MARNGKRNRGNNNNPEGRNQYNSGWMDTAKERPVAAAAAAAAAVGAGVFLWSRRNQISDQISNLSEQISDWSSSMRSGSDDDGEFEMAGDIGSSSMNSGGSQTSGSRTSRSTGSRPTSTRATGSNSRSGRGMGEIGGGNSSLGAHSGTTGTGAGS